MKNLSNQTAGANPSPYIPKSIREEKDPQRKAELFYQMGYKESECDKLGVSADLVRALEEKYKGGSIPLRELSRFGPRKVEPKENEQLIGQGTMTYGDWKGVTGPGAQFKEILAAQKKSKSMEP